MSARTHLVVGAGAIGSAVVRRLSAQGDTVRLVTRSGSGPDLPRVERIAADAGDAARLTELAHGADAIYNCANPAYHRWVTDWPPVATALLGAAEASGAVLVTCSNLYGYGPVSGPMTEDLPLAAQYTKGRVRAQMWDDALAAHKAGRARVTEARGSDYVGPGSQSHLGDRSDPEAAGGQEGVAAAERRLAAHVDLHRGHGSHPRRPRRRRARVGKGLARAERAHLHPARERSTPRGAGRSAQCAWAPCTPRS
jgi:nucleoside-diphosphate-sugar epimerase